MVIMLIYFNDKAVLFIKYFQLIILMISRLHNLKFGSFKRGEGERVVNIITVVLACIRNWCL